MKETVEGMSSMATSLIQNVLSEKAKELLPLDAVKQYQDLATDKVKEMGGKITEVSSSAIDTATTWLQAAITTGIDKLPFGDTVKDTLKDVNKGVCAAINSVGKELVNTALEAGKKVLGNIVENFGGVAKSIFSGVCDFLSGKKSKDQALSGITEAVVDAKDKIQTTAIDAAKGTVDKIKGDLTKGVGDVTEKVQTGSQKVVEGVTKEVIGKFTKGVVEKESAPNVSKER